MAKKLSVSGTLEHVIYNPKGGIEGVLVRTAKGNVQWVLDKEDAAAAAQLAAAGADAALEARVELMPPSDKGPAAHPVYRLVQLGAEPKKSDGKVRSVFRGVVVRFNYARHGEANGVVLDNGDFIHTRPAGMRAVALHIGSEVVATGEARRLQHGPGHVVEATEVNGVAVGKHPGAKPAKKAAKKVAKKATKKAAKKVVKTAAKKAPTKATSKKATKSTMVKPAAGKRRSALT